MGMILEENIHPLKIGTPVLSGKYMDRNVVFEIGEN